MYHVLHNPAILQRLRAELRAAWPTLENAPRYETLEKLPYLVCLVERPIALTASMWRLHAKTDGTSSQTAVIKEGLRMFPSAIAHPRVVPPEGAVISGSFIPGGTVVGQSFVFVHRSPIMYKRPEEFLPERWLGPEAKACETALSVFSKGPRSCFGVNLAYIEMYMGLAHLFRMFELQLDESRPASLKIREHFVPVFVGEPLYVYCKPAVD
jgi:cytochrome P450